MEIPIIKCAIDIIYGQPSSNFHGFVCMCVCEIKKWNGFGGLQWPQVRGENWVKNH